MNTRPGPRPAAANSNDVPARLSGGTIRLIDKVNLQSAGPGRANIRSAALRRIADATLVEWRSSWNPREFSSSRWTARGEPGALSHVTITYRRTLRRRRAPPGKAARVASVRRPLLGLALLAIGLAIGGPALAQGLPAISQGPAGQAGPTKGGSDTSPTGSGQPGSGQSKSWADEVRSSISRPPGGASQAGGSRSGGEAGPGGQGGQGQPKR